ncbi:uncharacterized protein LOC109724768 [Ananas comosus]|uniref:Uncharacterized protein LOC109724768 n=1 Tax=Ananas comosus TaxID=4615 RepID=A0A6P5GTT2_ANACO|nr:uncharacterized protein LOC109724768 [Ananas comosus]
MQCGSVQMPQQLESLKEKSHQMEELKKLDKDAYDWLRKISPNQWSKAYFSSRAKSDILVNNLSESFNSCILEARDKPIVSMLEWIRVRLMKKFYIKREGMEKYRGPICPNIQKKLEKLKVDARHCFPIPCGRLKYEVDCLDGKHAVDLVERQCSCRLWDLTGITCKHAIAAIFTNKERPEDYLHQCYTKAVYLKVYEEIINPIPGQNEWIKTSMPAPVPWRIRRPPGRPKKLRRRAADEPLNPYKVSRMDKPIKCGNCGKEGHNLRTCTASVTGETSWQRRVRTQKEKQRATNKFSQIGEQFSVSQPITTNCDNFDVETHSIGASQPMFSTERVANATAKGLAPVRGRGRARGGRGSAANAAAKKANEGPSKATNIP